MTGFGKRCSRGKSCGASCINRQKFCKKDLPASVGNSLSYVRGDVKNTLPRTYISDSTKNARLKADEVDNSIKKQGVSSERGDKSYDWSLSKRGESKYLGEGSFGVVSRESGTGNIVKRGEIGRWEAEALEKAGKLDLAPKLIAYQGDGVATYSGSPQLVIGRVSMTLAPGEMIGSSRQPDDKIGGERVADAYWKARANLHRAGIAHNDMHIDNVIVDGKGKARFIDFGHSRVSSKAALAEALGAFSRDFPGDYQVKRWSGTGGELLKKVLSDPSIQNLGVLSRRAPVLRQVLNNLGEVKKELVKDGLEPWLLRSLANTGIEETWSSSFGKFGNWAKISEDQAQKYINILYKGI